MDQIQIGFLIYPGVVQLDVMGVDVVPQRVVIDRNRRWNSRGNFTPGWKASG